MVNVWRVGGFLAAGEGVDFFVFGIFGEVGDYFAAEDACKGEEGC